MGMSISTPSMPFKMKIMVVGLKNAGKSTLLKKANLGHVYPHQHRNIEQEKVTHGNMIVYAWDLKEGSEDDLVVKSYIREADKIIFVVDSTDRERIKTAKCKLHEVLPKEKKVEVLVCANKQDKLEAMSISDIIDELDLHAIKQNPWCIRSICATTGQGIYESLGWAALEKNEAALDIDMEEGHTTPNNTNHDQQTQQD